MRRHPNWLLTSLILSSVAIAEGLPLILTHLFQAGALQPFICSTLIIAFVGELLPQALMPIFILNVAGRSKYILQGIMWTTAPLSAPIGWGFSKLRTWGQTGKPGFGDGILNNDELVEFVKVHEIGEGVNGKMPNGVGEVLRILEQRRTVMQAGDDCFEQVYVIDENAEIEPELVKSIRSSRCQYAAIMSYSKDVVQLSGNAKAGQVLGVLSTEVSQLCVTLLYSNLY